MGSPLSPLQKGKFPVYTPSWKSPVLLVGAGLLFIEPVWGISIMFELENRSIVPANVTVFYIEILADIFNPYLL